MEVLQMKKKNAILTFHEAPNYGAILQAYALQKAASQFDPDIEIIDYRADFIKKNYSPYRIKNGYLKSLLRILLYSSNEKKHNHLFEQYRLKYLNLSKEQVYTQAELKDLCTQYGNILCGSDQIWNTAITEGDLSYFLPFPLVDTKKNSYAASMGNLEIEKNKSIKDYLMDFENVAVREKDTAEKLNRLYSIPAKAYVDPTLLLSKDQWNNFAEEKISISEPYILIYTVKQPKKLIEEALELGKQKGLKVIQITNRKQNKGVISMKYQSPCQFVSLFREASYVFTNSFHGSVFSIIYQKKFVVELEALDGSVNNRTESLFKDLEIPLEFVKNVENIDCRIHWENIEKKLVDRKEQSLSFLREILT